MTFEEAKNEIKNKIDIVDIIGKDVDLKPASGGDFQGLCPFHNEKTPSFHVRRNQQYYHCFGCGKSGDIFKYLEDHNQMSFKEAMDYLCDMIGITYEKSHVDTGFNKKKQKVYDIYKEAAKEYFRILISDEGKPCLKYFNDRKLTFDTIKKFGLGYAPKAKDYMYKFLKGKGYTDEELINDAKICILNKEKNQVYDVWQDRAMFPVLDRMNKVITFSGRLLDENGWDERKYVNGYATIIWDKSNNLFCLNIAQNTKEKFMILCEGNMDCITLYQAGFDNVVAPLGTAFTKEQANVLTRYKKDVYLALDSDEAGRNSIRTKVIPYFNDLNINTKVIDLKPAKDPDEFVKSYGINEFKKRVAKATDSLIFDIREMKNDYDLTQESGKSKYISDVIKKLVKISDAPTRDVYIKSVSNEISLDETKVAEYVTQYMKDGKTLNEDNVDKYLFDNKNIDKMKKEISANEKNLLEILTDYTNLIDILKGYIGLEDLESPVSKMIYQDILDGLDSSKLIEKYNINPENKNDKNYTDRLISDIVATSCGLDEYDAKVSLSNITKKIKISSLERKISGERDEKKILAYMDELNKIKKNNIIL